mmetsp:Transcript_12518/g.26528  ORF Transcript_12518/g.26528 Transcript_12518/m.26528 type:complete len:266 (-) Transcript_12518:190-987(-)
MLVPADTQHSNLVGEALHAASIKRLHRASPAVWQGGQPMGWEDGAEATPPNLGRLETVGDVVQLLKGDVCYASLLLRFQHLKYLLPSALQFHLRSLAALSLTLQLLAQPVRLLARLLLCSLQSLGGCAGRWPGSARGTTPRLRWRTAVPQRCHYCVMALVLCLIERCMPFLVRRPDVCPLLQKQPHRALMTILTCEEERRHAVLVRRRDVGGFVQQQPHCVLMTIHRCEVERRLVVIVPRRDVGVVLQQQPHCALMTILRCHVER